MMKKRIFAPLMGAVVLGLGAYVGYHTYDAYVETNESDLLLANAEALADGEGGGCHNTDGYRTWESKGDVEQEFYDCCAVLMHGYNPSGNCW